MKRMANFKDWVFLITKVYYGFSLQEYYFSMINLK